MNANVTCEFIGAREAAVTRVYRAGVRSLMRRCLAWPVRVFSWLYREEFQRAVLVRLGEHRGQGCCHVARVAWRQAEHTVVHGFRSRLSLDGGHGEGRRDGRPGTRLQGREIWQAWPLDRPFEVGIECLILLGF